MLRSSPGNVERHVGELAAGLGHHPLAQAEDEPGLLGERDEMAGEQAAMARVVPPHQRLDAPGPPAAETDDRLVVERELVPLDGERQRALQLEPLVDRGVHVRAVDLGAPLAGALRRVHGHVGVPEQVVRRIGARRARDADAGVDVHLVAAEQERRLHRLAEPLHQRRRVHRAALLQEDRELVAAESRHRVGHPGTGAEPLGRGDEQPVADRRGPGCRSPS